MKKVLFVATVAGHITAFHIPYLKLFKEKGWETYVAAKNDLSTNKKIDYCDHFYEISIERSPFKLKNLKAMKELKEIIDKEHFDIIHCHTPMGSVVARLAARKARKKGTRVIYTAHGFHFYKGAPLINWLLFYPVEKWLSKYTDTLITINKEDYNLAKKKFNNRCYDIEYVPGVGIDTKKFDFKMTKKEKHELRKSLGLEDDDFVLIFPARLNKDKNQILLINFMEKNQNKKIKLLLPGPDEMNGFYDRIINNKKIKNVLLLGYRNDIPQLLKISDLLVATSLREGFGINLVEAIFNEIPVIAVENRGHKEIIEDGKNGFIVNNSLKDLEDKFYLLYNNRDLYDNIKSYCKESSKKFLLDNSLKLISGIYFDK